MNRSEAPHHPRKDKDAFEKEINLMVIVGGIIQYGLVALGIGIWAASVLAEGFYLGKFLQMLAWPEWLKSWIVPIFILLIPIIGFLLPILIYFAQDKSVEKEMPVHLRTKGTINILKSSVIAIGVAAAVIAPMFLAVLINKVFGYKVLILVLGISLVILMAVILNQIGFFRKIKQYIKARR